MSDEPIGNWDEFLIHQAAKPIERMESEDIDAMERLYVGCHNADGSLHVATGLGSYPNRNVMDAYVCVRHRDTQYNLRASRHLEDDRSRLAVGPISFEVVKPQQSWRVRVDDPEHGVDGEIEFEARGAPFMTGPPSHYDQLGRYSGRLEVGGEPFDLNGFMGARDRSWGVRPSGLFTRQDWSGHFWIHAHFPSFGLTLVHAGIWNGNKRCGAALVRDSGDVVPIIELRHHIEFEPDVRGLKSLEVELKDTTGERRRMFARRISPAIYLNGGGYDRPGEDRGPFSVEYDEWDVATMPDERSPRFGLHQQIAAFELDGERGVGILEASFSPDPARAYVPTLE